jgi:hypothetical protein
VSRDAVRSPLERRPATALAGLLLAAAAWALFVLYAWMLVPVACDRGSAALVHLVAAAVLLVAVGGLLGALRLRRDELRADRPSSQLTVAAVSLSTLFVAGIVLFWVFAAAFDPCWR